MRAHEVHVEHDFPEPPDKVFPFLAEHEHLADLFGAKVSRLADGSDGNRNGVGSRRKLQIGPLPPFEETVTEYVPNAKIEYRITKGSPLKGHVGTMRFSPGASGGTHLDYRIRLASAIPGLAVIVHKSLSRSIPRGLAGARIPA
jgi:uncharacterized protein YndB with AHSA1/START domain